jgi:hypothetical protein
VRGRPTARLDGSGSSEASKNQEQEAISKQPENTAGQPNRIGLGKTNLLNPDHLQALLPPICVLYATGKAAQERTADIVILSVYLSFPLDPWLTIW